MKTSKKNIFSKLRKSRSKSVKISESSKVQGKSHKEKPKRRLSQKIFGRSKSKRTNESEITSFAPPIVEFSTEEESITCTEASDVKNRTLTNMDSMSIPLVENESNLETPSVAEVADGEDGVVENSISNANIVSSSAMGNALNLNANSVTEETRSSTTKFSDEEGNMLLKNMDSISLPVVENESNLETPSVVEVADGEDGVVENSISNANIVSSSAMEIALSLKASSGNEETRSSTTKVSDEEDDTIGNLILEKIIVDVPLADIKASMKYSLGSASEEKDNDMIVNPFLEINSFPVPSVDRKSNTECFVPKGPEEDEHETVLTSNLTAISACSPPDVKTDSKCDAGKGSKNTWLQRTFACCAGEEEEMKMGAVS